MSRPRLIMMDEPSLGLAPLVVRDIFSIIREINDSGITVLHGNLAPEGAVVKHCAMDKSMYHFVGRARTFDTEEEAVAAIYEDRVQPGEVVVIRYRGKHAAGMPEMLKATDAICNKPALCRSTALITDGRFSGASRGPCVGYLLPEAADGGPIGLVRDGDLIEIDVLRRSLELVGLEGQRRDPREIAAELSVRKRKTPVKTFRHQGALRYLSN